MQYSFAFAYKVECEYNIRLYFCINAVPVIDKKVLEQKAMISGPQEQNLVSYGYKMSLYGLVH